MKAFIDTPAFFSLWWPKDDFHEPAKIILDKLDPYILFTSNFIIDETLILLSKKASRDLAFDFGVKLFDEELVEIVTVGKDTERAAWDIFKSSQDQDLSFTDCTSFAIMKDYDIKEAFAFDKHFEDFGLRILK